MHVLIKALHETCRQEKAQLTKRLAEYRMGLQPRLTESRRPNGRLLPLKRRLPVSIG